MTASNGQQWKYQRERILFFVGIALITFETINAELFSGTFHVEFLIAGLALCGISLAQLGDKR